jgi:hypothetical protein
MYQQRCRGTGEYQSSLLNYDPQNRLKSGGMHQNEMQGVVGGADT